MGSKAGIPMVAARDHQDLMQQVQVQRYYTFRWGPSPPQSCHSPHSLFHHLSAPLSQVSSSGRPLDLGFAKPRS